MAIDVGAEAPDFALSDQHGVELRLSDFRETRSVVVVFYPFAFTGVCTGELRALQDELPRFSSVDAAVVGISCDTKYSQRVFADREGLSFPLLSDYWPHGEVARSYGVFDEERGCALRGTFIVDRSGIVGWSVVNAIADAREIDAFVKAAEQLRA